MTLKSPVVIVGAGGFGREAADTAVACGHPVLGVVDDAPSPVNVARLKQRDIPLLGGLDELLGTDHAVPFVLGIGNPSVRRALVARLVSAGVEPATLIHPSAVLGTRFTVGAGSVICAGVCVSTNVVLGAHVHLNPNCTVGHDAVLDDYVSVNPASTIGGEVHIAAGTLLGSASNILQGLHIGKDTVIGASALVTKNVPDGVVVKGIPGRWP